MKIAILGLGHVGSTLAYTLVLKGLGDEILLWNKRPEVARGEALDLEHCLSFTPKNQVLTAVENLGGIRDADLIVITVSTPWKPEYKVRTDLVRPNAEILQTIVPEIVKTNPNAVLVILTNPVDVMTELVWRLSGWNYKRVIGMGTLLDSARLRSELSRELSIHPSDIRAYVLGEHGETQFPFLSSAQAGGEKLSEESGARRLQEKARSLGHLIISGKGYTNFGVSAATALLIETIVQEQNRTMPVSVHLENWNGVSGVALSVPAVIGRGGVVRLLESKLDPREQADLEISAKAVHEAGKMIF